MNPSCSWSSAASASAALCPESTVTFSGISGRMRPITSSTSAPGTTWADPPETSSWRSMTAWAVGRSKKIQVEPPRLSCSPNPAMPTRVYSRARVVGVMIETVSPIVNSPRSTREASMAISSGPTGYSPSRITKPDVSPSTRLAPTCGGPCPPMGSPSASNAAMPSDWMNGKIESTPSTSLIELKTSSDM